MVIMAPLGRSLHAGVPPALNRLADIHLIEPNG